MERNYTTQMDAARRGIVTPELETVARKERMTVEELMPLVASGKVAIPANRLHKCLDAEGIGSMLRTKINVNLGVSRDCKDYDVEMKKVLSAVVEFSVDEERLIPILQKIQRQAGQLDTVMSVGVAYRSDREGSFQEVLRRLDQAGFFYRENVKMNMGLGSPLYQEAEGEI